ncbi:MAG: DUF6062 family protein [Anaerolineae bacterium]
MGLPMSFYDLREALAQPGCAICRLKARCAEKSAEILLWEQVNDPGVRHNVRQARGFCREHAWALVRWGASLGVAILLRDVLQDALQDLKEVEFQPSSSLSLRRAQEALNRDRPSAATAEAVERLAPGAPCPICLQAETMERIYLSTLADHLLGEEGLLASYQASEGLCFPHFRMVLGFVREESVFEALVAAQKRIWQRLVDQLSESIRKSDYRFRDEPVGEEGGSWLRAIAAVAGGSPPYHKRWVHREETHHAG